MRELPLDPAVLAAHDGFVRRLAARLATGEVNAHDLAQETWLAALTGAPPADAGRLRAWLASVMRNQRAFVLRSAARRADREALAPRVDEQESTAQLVERIELHKRTVDAVLALPDELRTIVLLHFFERLSTAEIAARLALPPGTVRARLTRALDCLRTKLRASFGDDHAAFVPALACLARGGGTSPAAALTLAGSPLVVATLAKTFGALAAVALAVFGVWRVAHLGGPRPEVATGSEGSSALADDTRAEKTRARATPPAAEGDDGAARVAAAAADPLEIAGELHVAPRPVLHVVDTRSGAELADVNVLLGVVTVAGSVAPGAWQPSNVIAHGKSPLVLPEIAAGASLWVGARGYTWSPIHLATDSGGEREVRLARAAALEVTVENRAPDVAPRVRVFRPGATGLEDALAEREPDAEGRAVFDALPPGPCEVHAETVIWYAPPRVLARANVELHAEETSRVVLTLDHPLLDVPAEPLSGVIELPAGHTDLRVVLRMRPTNAPPLRKADWVRLPRAALRQDPEHAGRLHFDAGRVTPGPYVAIVDPVQCVSVFEVGAGGLRDLRLVVPELQRVDVSVVDRATGEPLAADRIAWGVPSPFEPRAFGFDNVLPGRVPGAFTFLAPAGRIGVTAFTLTGYDETTVWTEVGASPVSLRIELARLAGVRIAFRDGATVVPADVGHMEFVLTRRGATQALELDREFHCQHTDAGWCVLVEEPGVYVVEFPKLPGFERIEPRELDFVPGPLRDVVVPLVRTR